MSDTITSNAPRPWRPAPILSASIALQVTAAAAIAIRPHVWPWALGAMLADHVVLTGIGLWPRSTLLGPNWTRLPEAAANRSAMAITIDDGPDPDITPRVLDLLDQRAVKATFFCVGERVLQHPGLAREIVRRGHAIENHSQRHRHHFSLMGPRSLGREIGRAQETIAAVVGVAPRFFRAPAGLRNPWLDPVLTRFDLRLASWTRRGFDTASHDAGEVLGRLTRNLGPGDILLLHDGHAGRTRAGEPIVFEILPKLLAAVAAANLRPIMLREALS